MKNSNFVIVLFFLVFISNIYAKKLDHSGELVYINQVANYDDKDMRISVSYDVKVYWKFSVLMGEPVIYSQMFWKLSSSTATIKDKTLTRYQFGGLYDSSLDNKVKLYEFKIQPNINHIEFSEHQMNKTITVGTLNIDTGVGTYPYYVAKSIFDIKFSDVEDKYKSYNTPGSPSWDKLIIRGKDKYATKEEAISIFSEDRVWLTNGTIKSAKIDFSGLIEHFRKKLKKEKDKEKELSKKQKLQDDSFEDMLDSVEKPNKSKNNTSLPSDIKTLEKQIKEKQLTLRSEPFKTTYLADQKKCGTMPNPPAEEFKCTYKSMVCFLMSYSGGYSLEKERAIKEKCNRERREDQKKGCQREKEAWEESKKTYPKRLKEWKIKNQQCINKAKDIYSFKLQKLLNEVKEIEDSVNDIKW